MRKLNIWFLMMIILTISSGCTITSEIDDDNLAFLETRRDSHRFLRTGVTIGEYEVLEKEHDAITCQAEVLSTVYYSKSGEYYSFKETECTPDPTYYIYYEFQYLTFNEAESIGVILDNDIVSFCKEYVLVIQLIDDDSL